MFLTRCAGTLDWVMTHRPRRSIAMLRYYVPCLCVFALTASPALAEVASIARPCQSFAGCGLAGWSFSGRWTTADSGRDASAEAALLVREQEAAAALAARGVVGVRRWRSEGTTLHGVGEWFGETVDVQVDLETGEIKQPDRLKATQIERMLTMQGWGPVREIQRGGDTFIVRAERNAHVYDLRIDARTGHIEGAR